MPKPKKTKDILMCGNRVENLIVKMTTYQKYQLRKNAEAAGMTMSQYIIHFALPGNRVVACDNPGCVYTRLELDCAGCGVPWPEESDASPPQPDLDEMGMSPLAKWNARFRTNNPENVPWPFPGPMPDHLKVIPGNAYPGPTRPDPDIATEEEKL